MSFLTLVIPLQLPPHNRFFQDRLAPQKLLGFDARLRLEPPPGSAREAMLGPPPYAYLELQQVPADQVNEVFESAVRCIKWAAVRLNTGILADREPLRRVDTQIFAGQFATAYPAEMQANPIRVEGSERNGEPSNRLFAALSEAASKAQIASPSAKKTTLLACEFFATADFEITSNSQFLMLCTVLEILADPKQRPTLCIYLVEELLENIQKAQTIASQDDTETSEALEGLQNAVVHYKKESITTSIRKLGTKIARTLGDLEPEKMGKQAVALYTKRNNLVHGGENVTSGDVSELRRLTREALAVEIGCYDHIREHFPA